MLQYTFEELKSVRVQFTAEVLNARSRATILHLSAVEGGVIRKERIMPNGRQRDSVRYSIIYDEWAKVRHTLERTLAANNPTQ
jgi:RimJ/RimL family protein N-acetyltransferase